MDDQMTEPVCPRHRDRVSYVTCQRCRQPVCPECQRPAAVGVQCVGCVAAQQAAQRQTVSVLGGRAIGGRATVTLALIVVNCLVYAAQLARPSLTTDLLFWPMRAWDEPWRAITGAFLHSPSLYAGFLPVHLLLNMWFLWQIGPYLEQLLGHARFAAMYLLSAIGGHAMVLLLATPPASIVGLDPQSAWNTGVVGASGAVFGLFAALIVLQRHLGRTTGALWLTLALNVVLSLTWPGISWQGHLGGLLTGALIAAIFTRLRGREQRGWQWVGLVAVGLLVVGAMVAKLLGVPDVFR